MAMGREIAMPSTPHKTNVCAVVVTYFPDAELVDRLDRIAPQVGKVVVVDNGSDAATVSTLKSRGGIELIANQDNVGVATALNQAMTWARDHGFEWALTLDQDTVVDENMIAVFGEAFESCSGERKVAIIGANFIDRLTGEPLVPESACEGRLWADILTVITSGSLVSVEANQAIGPFRDEFFIDYLDAEYCLRAKQAGFNVVITKQPLMEHTVGHPRWHRFLGRRLITPHLSPERRYYMSRNFTVIAREYKRLEPDWVRWLAKVRLKEIVLILLFERRKARKMANTLRGVFDALRGRMGRL